jgi:hypothetical protein
MGIPSAKDEILAALPSTKIGIVRKTGIHPRTVLKWIGRLHGNGVYIKGWLPHPVRGPAMAVYARGNKPDAPNTLPKLTKKEVRERYRDRWAGTEKGDKRSARYRERYWQKKAAKCGDPLVAALFGSRRQANEDQQVA